MAATLAPERHPGVEQVIVRPQPGPQEAFLSSPADIAIIGGSVFGGKTWALTYEPLRHVGNPGFTFVAFRRTTPEIRNPGGMWDESQQIYPLLGAEPRETTLDWLFPSGARGKMAGLQYDSDVLAWKGAQVCCLLFDQLEEFTEKQFFYLLSRNRSTCGVRPYVRASCNPDPDSWLATFLAWWIDQDTGYAIPERSGVLRWFIRLNDEIHWAGSREELIDRFGSKGTYAKSVTFILARLQDNAIGNRLNPEYEATIRAMSYVEQERLLGGDRGGNWKIRPEAGKVFNRAWFEIVDAAPAVARRCRGWDKAGTTGGGDWTVGARIAESGGIWYVEDIVRDQWSAGDREATIRQTAQLDGTRCWIRVEQEPGSGGKESAENTIRGLAGYNVAAVPSTTNKVERAQGLAAQAQAKNVKLVRGLWNEAFLRELHAFDGTGKVPDDQVDAISLAFNTLALGTRPNIRSLD
jgi:predicted phage terminase large subunit-like protein